MTTIQKTLQQVIDEIGGNTEGFNNREVIQ